MSLKDPVRLFTNENTETALNLRQEFIRIRENHENDREVLVAGKSFLFQPSFGGSFSHSPFFKVKFEGELGAVVMRCLLRFRFSCDFT